jgi:tetratricopeptide (TPR) repeat protein
MSSSEALSLEERLDEASANRDEGCLEEAVRLYRLILQEHPQNTEAQKALHKLQKLMKKTSKKGRGRSGRRAKTKGKARLAKAGSQPVKETAASRSVAQPAVADIDALISLYRAGQLGEAETRARRLSKKYPRSVDVLRVLAASLSDQGKFDDAVIAFQKLLEIKPDYAAGHNNLGNALKNLGRLDEAVASFQQALKISPDLAVLHNNLGNALNSLGRSEEAVTSYQQALKIEPDFADAHNNLGSALNSLGRPVEAIASYLQAIRVNPGFVTAIHNLGNIYERTNKLDHAEECVQKALHIAPDDPAVNLSRAVLLKRKGEIKLAIETLEPIIGKAIPETLLSEIHNELGKLYDREHNGKKAFQHFASANEIHATNEMPGSFRKETFLSEVQHTARFLTSGARQAIGKFRETTITRCPLFLVGFPRSGTTLLDQILDSHSGIQVMEEKPIIDNISLKLTDEFDDYSTAFSALDQAGIEGLRDFYFQSVERYIALKPDTLLIDKFPLNIRHVPLILCLFPEARFFLALRHPCDVALSNFMQLYKMNDAMANFFTLADTAHCYRQVMSLWQRCAAELPVKFHTVKYESLVADFETEVRCLVQFLGLNWDDAVLNYSDHAKQREIINTPSYQAVTEPINQRAKFRWKRYQDELEPVLEDLTPFIEAFGYGE